MENDPVDADSRLLSAPRGHGESSSTSGNEVLPDGRCRGDINPRAAKPGYPHRPYIDGTPTPARVQARLSNQTWVQVCNAGGKIMYEVHQAPETLTVGELCRDVASSNKEHCHIALMMASHVLEDHVLLQELSNDGHVFLQAVVLGPRVVEPAVTRLVYRMRIRDDKVITGKRLYEADIRRALSGLVLLIEYTDSTELRQQVASFPEQYLYVGGKTVDVKCGQDSILLPEATLYMLPYRGVCQEPEANSMTLEDFSLCDDVEKYFQELKTDANRSSLVRMSFEFLEMPTFQGIDQYLLGSRQDSAHLQQFPGANVRAHTGANIVGLRDSEKVTWSPGDDAVVASGQHAAFATLPLFKERAANKDSPVVGKDTENGAISDPQESLSLVSQDLRRRLTREFLQQKLEYPEPGQGCQSLD